MKISATSGLQSAAQKKNVYFIYFQFFILEVGSTLNVLQIISKRVLGYSFSRF